MRYREKKIKARKALTLLEMVIAMAIITVVFSSILPLFRNVQAGWDARRGGSETIQNGRVAMEHLHSSITEALKITAVSLSSDTDGYIEFVDNTGVTLRCDLAANNYIQFGPVGNQAELAGPVTSLKFTCYALDDMDTATTDVELIRFVKIDADFVNSATNGKDKSFSTSAHLRANASAGGWSMGPVTEYDKKEGDRARLVKIMDGKYLCVYEQRSNHGWATVLSVDSEKMKVTAYKNTDYLNGNDGDEPFVIKLDTEHYMVFYFENSNDPGYVAVLTVDTDNWTVSLETNTKFEPKKAENLVAVEIDSTHFLCLYMGNSDHAYAVIVELDRSTWEVTVVSDFERIYDRDIESPDLVAIDATHFLYAFERDQRDDLYAGVLKIDTDDWEIHRKSKNRFDRDAEYLRLARIDSTHYLCTFIDDDEKSGHALILEVDTGTWEVDEGNKYTFYEDGIEGHAMELIKLEGTDDTFLALFNDRSTDAGYGVVLTVDVDADVVTCSTPYMFFEDDCAFPRAIWIEGPSYLCAYKGKDKDGFAFVFNYTGGGEVLP